jgi:hypothetical protein
MVEMVVSLTARSWQRMCVFFFSFSRFRQIHDTQHGRFVCPPVFVCSSLLLSLSAPLGQVQHGESFLYADIIHSGFSERNLEYALRALIITCLYVIHLLSSIMTWGFSIFKEKVSRSCKKKEKKHFHGERSR